MRFALRSRRGPHVSVGQVRSFLATLKFTLVTPCPLLFTTAHCYSPLPTYIHPCPLYSPQPTFIHPCPLIFTPAYFYFPLSTYIYPCLLLFTPAYFYFPLPTYIHTCQLLFTSVLFTCDSAKFPSINIMPLWHLPFQGSMKQLRREIDRRLDYVNYVTHEPQVNCWNVHCKSLHPSWNITINDFSWESREVRMCPIIIDCSFWTRLQSLILW